MKNSVDMNATPVLTELDEQELKGVNGGCLGPNLDSCTTGNAYGYQADPCLTGYAGCAYGYQADPCLTGGCGYSYGYRRGGWRGRWGSHGFLRAGIRIW